MKDHSHPEPKRCAHDLAWCDKCERPYCKTSGQEWYVKAESVMTPSVWEQLRRDEHKGIRGPKIPPTDPWAIPRWISPYGPGRAAPAQPGQRYEILCEHRVK